MGNWIVSILDRIFAVIGALLFSQMPQFMQLYKHQLNGHVAELRLQVNHMLHNADLSGASLAELLQKFLNSNDIDFSRQGQAMEMMVNRYHSLSDSLFALNHSSVFSRPFTFLWNLDWEIAKGTLANFSLGITFTMEGLFYAFIGIITGYALFRGLTLIYSKFITQVLESKV